MTGTSIEREQADLGRQQARGCIARWHARKHLIPQLRKREQAGDGEEFSDEVNDIHREITGSCKYRWEKS